MKILQSFLRTIRLLDEDNTVSFTSLYLYAGIALVSCHVNEWTVALLTLIFVHTNLKRLSRHKATVRDQKQEVEVKAVQAAVDAQAAKDKQEVEAVSKKVDELSRLIKLKQL